MIWTSGQAFCRLAWIQARRSLMRGSNQKSACPITFLNINAVHERCMLCPYCVRASALHARNSFLVFRQRFVETLSCGCVAGDIVRRVYVKLDAAIDQYLRHCDDRHPNAGYKSHCRNGTQLVLMVSDRNRGVFGRCAGVDDDICDVKDSFAARVARLLALCLGG